MHINSFNLHSVHMYIYTQKMLLVIPSMLYRQTAVVSSPCDLPNLIFLFIFLFTHKRFGISEPSMDNQRTMTLSKSWQMLTEVRTFSAFDSF